MRAKQLRGVALGRSEVMSADPWLVVGAGVGADVVVVAAVVVVVGHILDSTSAAAHAAAEAIQLKVGGRVWADCNKKELLQLQLESPCVWRVHASFPDAVVITEWEDFDVVLDTCVPGLDDQPDMRHAVKVRAYPKRVRERHSMLEM